MRRIKRIVLMLLVITLLIAGWGFYLIGKPYRQLSNSWMAKEKQVGPVIGDLGGIPVAIPDHFARFVEYDSDPHFLESRNGPRPTRTFQSKLRSFGFDVRYPDLAPSTLENMREKYESNIYNTMWFSVGVQVATYNNELGLQRRVDAISSEKWDSIHTPNDPPEIWRNKHWYNRLPDTSYGLVVYEVQGYDDAKRYITPGHDISDKNIYYHISARGKVDSYIECSNVKHDAAPCEQDFILPKAENTLVKVHYRIGFLPQWKEIQVALAKVILGFAVPSQGN